jgi:hypothetical protein
MPERVRAKLIADRRKLLLAKRAEEKLAAGKLAAGKLAAGKLVAGKLTAKGKPGKRSR